MATLTILIWMIVIVLFFHGLINYVFEAVESDETFMLIPKTLMGSWVLIHFVTIVPISIGLYWDIFGEFPETDIALTYESVNFYLLCGLVALGVTTISSIWMSNQRSKKIKAVKQSNKNPVNISIRAIVDLIGLIASVLGIVSFYLEHVIQ